MYFVCNYILVCTLIIDIGKYFSKKCELSSNNSTDGNISKKAKEEVIVSASSYISICNADVFSGGGKPWL